MYASRKDGTEVPVEIGLSPIETKQGTLTLSAVIDVTERAKSIDHHCWFRLAVPEDIAGHGDGSRALHSHLALAAK